MVNKNGYRLVVRITFLLIAVILLCPDLKGQDLYLESDVNHEDPISCTLITPDGKYLIKSYSRESIKRDTLNIQIFNASTLKLARSISILVQTGGDIRLSENGRQIIAQYYDKQTIYGYFDIETGEKIKEIKLSAGWGLAISHDSIFCIRSMIGNKLTIYDSRTKVSTELGSGRLPVFCNQGANILAVDGKKLILINTTTGVISDKWSIPGNNYAGGIKIAPDSKHFVVHSISKNYYGTIENDKIVYISTLNTGYVKDAWVQDSYFVPGDEFVFIINNVSIQKFNVKNGQRIFSESIVRYYISRFGDMGKSQKLKVITRFGTDYLLLTSERNISYFFSLKTNHVDAFFYTWNKRDYAFITPDGRMEGTPGAIENLEWVKDDRKIPLATTFDQMYTPNLINQFLTSTLVDNSVKLDEIVKYTPEIKILNPKPESKTSTPTLAINCELKENGDEISKVRIYVNDKLVSDETRGMKAAGTTVTYNVTLLPGLNSVKAIAITKNAYQSGAAVVQVTYSGAVAESRLYVMAIGINKYKNPAYNLNYAVADASSIVDRISSSGIGIFKSIKIYSYENENAKRDSILGGFDKIAAQAQPQDAFILFYAGHGVMSEGAADVPKDFYLVLQDITQLYGNDKKLKERGISAAELRELSKKITAQKQVVFLDACQSGAAVETFAMRGAAEEKAILQLARSTGSYLIASTGSEQFATEFKELGHGVFTYAILKGLDCNAEGSDKDKKITIQELNAYLNDYIPILTEKYHGMVQYPKAWSMGMDFPIAVCK